MNSPKPGRLGCSVIAIASPLPLARPPQTERHHQRERNAEGSGDVYEFKSIWSPRDREVVEQLHAAESLLGGPRMAAAHYRDRGAHFVNPVSIGNLTPSPSSVKNVGSRVSRLCRLGETAPRDCASNPGSAYSGHF